MFWSKKELLKSEKRALKKQFFFDFIYIFAFFILGIIGILRHSMWRDELNVWLLTRDSHSIAELFGNIKYEGHPILWYICLDTLNRFTSNPLAMQVFHILIGTASIYLFFRFSPFTRHQKVIFSLGYFPLYEYFLISRNYALGVFFLFLFCIFFDRRKQSYLLPAVILALLANTNAYCLFIAFALGLTLILEYAIASKIQIKLVASPINIVTSLMIFLGGLMVSFLMIIPPKNSNLHGGESGWFFHFDWQRLGQAICRIWNSYIIILTPGDNQNLSLFFFAIVSLTLLAFFATLFRDRIVVLFFYLFASLEIVSFTYVRFLGYPRHYGHLYFVLIASLWLASYYSPVSLWGNAIQPKLSRWIQFVRTNQKTLLLIILYAQLAGGIVTFGRDLAIPYSASRATAQFIKAEHLDNLFMVGSRDYTMTPIAGYLDRKIYYPETQLLGSFVIFQTERQEVGHEVVLEQISQLIKKHPKILLILNQELQLNRDGLRISLVKKFTHTFISDEKYYLYLVT